MTSSPSVNVGRFNDRALLFGAAIAQLVSQNRPVLVHEFPGSDNGLFEIRCGTTESLVLLKYATQARSPWYFTVSPDQLRAVRNGRLRYPAERRFMALVCHLDGVCLLSLAELDQIAEAPHQDGSCGLSIARPPRGQYRASGPGRTRLPHTVARSRWVTQMLNGEE